MRLWNTHLWPFLSFWILDVVIWYTQYHTVYTYITYMWLEVHMYTWRVRKMLCAALGAFDRRHGKGRRRWLGAVLLWCVSPFIVALGLVGCHLPGSDVLGFRRNLTPWVCSSSPNVSQIFYYATYQQLQNHLCVKPALFYSPPLGFSGKGARWKFE